jgi:hypothetical protein
MSLQVERAEPRRLGALLRLTIMGFALLRPGVPDLAILPAGALLPTGAAQAATSEPPRRPVKSVRPPVKDLPPAKDATPPKPSQQPSQQPSPQPAAPAAQPAPEPQRQPADVDPDKLQPYNLPPASRQRIRLCGERWRDLKMAGRSAGLTWRSFAEKCLPGSD